MSRRIVDWGSHVLAFGLGTNLDAFTGWCEQSAKLGFKFITIVPLVLAGCPDMTPDAVVGVLRKTGLRGRVCAFLPGDKFNINTEAGRDACLGELMQNQFPYTTAMVNAGCGDPVVGGPFDSPWKGDRAQFDQGNYQSWLGMLRTPATQLQLTFIFEFLNLRESQVDKPLHRLWQIVRNNPKFEIQWDTVHAGLLDVGNLFSTVAGKVGIFEASNFERNPLCEKTGTAPIDFPGYFDKFDRLPRHCTFGVEPFCYKNVITPLNIGDIYSTRRLGAETLALDAGYLKEEQVMAA